VNQNLKFISISRFKFLRGLIAEMDIEKSFVRKPMKRIGRNLNQ